MKRTIKPASMNWLRAIIETRDPNYDVAGMSDDEVRDYILYLSVTSHLPLRG